MEKQWQKNLFGHDAIVPVNFKRNKELELLTVLIMTQEKNGCPVISPVGSILDENLRQPTSATLLQWRWKRLKRSVKNELAKYHRSSKLRDGKHLKVAGKDFIVESFTASTSFFGSLFELLRAGAKSSGSLFCNLRHNQEVAVKPGSLHRLFDAQRPLWKPNMVEFNIHKHILSKDGWFVIWVVTKIFTATKLVIAKSQDDALEADVNISAVVGDMSDLLGKARLQCNRRTVQSVVIEAHDGEPPFTYGFRALRLEFDEHGTLKRMDHNMGDQLPIIV